LRKFAPSNWESDIENSIKTIILDGTSIRAKRHDDSLTGEIAWANPTDVSTLQTDLQDLEDDVNDKCVKTIEIKDGVLKGKRMDGSFTGNVDVILSTTLNAAVSSYLSTTLYKTLTELETLGYKTLTELQALGYKTLTELQTFGYKTLSELQTLGYYTLSQIQALNYVTKTTSSSWTSNAFISLSTDTHNQEVSCNFSKRSGLKANNPSLNDYAQANAANIELWDFSDSAGLAGAGGFHFNTTSERLAVANVPASSECFNHHLNVKCRDFYLNFNVTKWLPNTVANTWEWHDLKPRFVSSLFSVDISRCNCSII